MVKITLPGKAGITKNLIFESWALKNQWFPSVEGRTYASPPTHGHLGQIRAGRCSKPRYWTRMYHSRPQPVCDGDKIFRGFSVPIDSIAFAI